VLDCAYTEACSVRGDRGCQIMGRTAGFVHGGAPTVASQDGHFARSFPKSVFASTRSFFRPQEADALPNLTRQRSCGGPPARNCSAADVIERDASGNVKLKEHRALFTRRLAALFKAEGIPVLCAICIELSMSAAGRNCDGRHPLDLFAA